MDTYCTKCSEPWDVFEVSEAKKDPDGYGTEWVFGKHYKILECPCCIGKPSEKTPKTDTLTKGEAASILADLLGDDIDGAASILDDASFLGIIK